MDPNSPELFAPATSVSPPRVCVVAELGVNHDGSVDRAIQLVSAAASAGADAVKLQLFDPRNLLSNQARLAKYQAENSQVQSPKSQVQSPKSQVQSPRSQVQSPEPGTRNAEPSLFDLLDRLKLSVDDMAKVRDAAKVAGLLFVVTPFSLEDVEALSRLNVDAVKIASPDAVNHPLLKAAVALGKPMLVSTGTCELDELAFAAELVRRQGGSCLMQCVSSYPTPLDFSALGGIRALADRFAVAVGYSDHTPDLWAGALAVAAGACVLEKHLTHDRTAAGPDHAASLEAAELARYVKFVRRAARMLGPIAKTCSEVEADVRDVSRQSVCVLRDLPAGHVLGRGDLTVKRPGGGIPAARLDEMIGRTLVRAVRGNDLLVGEDLR